MPFHDLLADLGTHFNSLNSIQFRLEGNRRWRQEQVEHAGGRRDLFLGGGVSNQVGDRMQGGKQPTRRVDQRVCLCSANMWPYDRCLPVGCAASNAHRIRTFVLDTRRVSRWSSLRM